MSTLDTNKPVMVSGANGYIASWIVKKLLDKGCTVHATVRDPSDNERVGHLREIAEGSKGTLKFFQANLLEEGSFSQAMQGCEIVFHTASVVMFSSKNPQKDIVDPALFGTKNILHSVDACESVKKVILTSSIAAVYGYSIDMQRQNIEKFREEHWNTSSSLTMGPYSYAKTVAEKAAWQYAEQQKEQRWQLIVMNPGFVVGPTLNKRVESSLMLLKQLGDGSMKLGTMNMMLAIVDVEDIADAHIIAAYKPGVSGRHILTAKSYSLLEMANILRSHFGDQYAFPKKNIPKWMLSLFAPLIGMSRDMVRYSVNFPLEFDNEYSKKDLGLEYRSVQDALIATFQQMIDIGIVQKK